MHRRTSVPPLARLLALVLPLLAQAATTPQHIIGSYILSPNAALLTPDTSACVTNITFSAFSFQLSGPISAVSTPQQFNIQIQHRATSLNSIRCTSFGTIAALQSDHPLYATDAQGILNAWTRTGGRSPPKPWAEQLITEAVKLSWLIAYDFTELLCADQILPPGVAYLWYQPQWDHIIADSFQVRGGTRYLFLNFLGGRNRGCVYEGDNIRGTGGPSSDPTNPDDDTPDDIPDPPPDQLATAAPPTTPPPPTPTPAATQTAGGDANGQEGGEGVFGEAAAAGEAGGGSGGGGPACFPAGEVVEAEGAGRLAVGAVGVGTRVRDSEGEWSDVFFFSHREAAGVFEFVRLDTAGGKAVVLSEGHYVYVRGGMVAAGGVKVGDLVAVRDGGWERVAGVGRVWREGRFAPHTLSGSLVVGGVVVSSYTTAVHPRLAHYVLLAPVRVLYRMGLARWADGWLDRGNERLRRWMPRGPRYARRISA